jgi:hypothetical protein
MPTVTSTLELSAARQFPVMRCARVPGFSIDLGRVVIHRCALMTQANTKMICTAAAAAAAAAAAKVHTKKESSSESQVCQHRVFATRSCTHWWVSTRVTVARCQRLSCILLHKSASTLPFPRQTVIRYAPNARSGTLALAIMMHVDRVEKYCRHFTWVGKKMGNMT